MSTDYHFRVRVRWRYCEGKKALKLTLGHELSHSQSWTGWESCFLSLGKWLLLTKQPIFCLPKGAIAPWSSFKMHILGTEKPRNTHTRGGRSSCWSFHKLHIEHELVKTKVGFTAQHNKQTHLYTHPSFEDWRPMNEDIISVLSAIVAVDFATITLKVSQVQRDQKRNFSKS